MTTEPCVIGHHALAWALKAARDIPALLDARGYLAVPVDGADYVTPDIGDPYVHIHTMFKLDANREAVIIRNDNGEMIAIETVDVDYRIWEPQELVVPDTCPHGPAAHWPGDCGDTTAALGALP